MKTEKGKTLGIWPTVKAPTELRKLVRRIKKLFKDDTEPDGWQAAAFTLGVHYQVMVSKRGCYFNLQEFSDEEIYGPSPKLPKREPQLSARTEKLSGTSKVVSFKDWKKNE